MLSDSGIRLNKKKILYNFIIYAAPILLLVNFFYSYLTRTQTNFIFEKANLWQAEIVNTINFQFEFALAGIYDDLNLISRSNELTSYLEEPTAVNRNKVDQMFSRVLKSKPSITQIRILTPAGMEEIRVNQNNGVIQIVSESGLQDKSDRYYYKSLLQLEREAMYISDFDLNIENNDYIIPYEPVIRMGKPVFFNDELKGFLLFNYDGMIILKFLSEYEKNKIESINIGLLDKNHLISLNLIDSYDSIAESLLTPNKEKHLDLYQKAAGQDSGSFYSDSKVFFYKKITEPSGQTWTFDPISENWILISSFDKEIIVDEEGNFLIQNTKILRILLLIIISAIILVVVTLSSLQYNDALLLIATGYISNFTHDGVLITDQHRKILYCNKIFERTFGYRFESIEGKNPKDFMESQTGIKLEGKANDNDSWEGNIWELTSYNTYILKYLRIKAVYNRMKKVAYYIHIYSEPQTDIPQNDTNYIISHRFVSSNIDFITSSFEEKFSKIEKKAVIVLKLTEFNTIRSYISDKKDNEIVNVISDSFQDIISNGGLVVIPGSGLILIAASMKSHPSVNSLMKNINASVSSIRFSIKTKIPIDYASGVAISPKHGQTASELINNACIALEALIKTKKSRYMVYEQDIYDLIKKDKIIRDEIENAFTNNEFRVVYQLQQDAAMLKYTGVETLVRWDSPKIGLVNPDSFIHILQESGQIIRLGKYVINLVVNDFKDYFKELPEDFHISLNLSTQEFNNSEIISDLIKIIDNSGIPRGLFCFEITETAVSDNVNFTNIITQKLQSQGIIVAIDNFGTGYSSLDYLKKIESDKIKIDRRFIKDYPLSDEGRILGSIIDMVKKIPKKIIVEGVETPAQLEFIRKYGCDEFQGYLSSKPVSINEIMGILEIKS